MESGSQANENELENPTKWNIFANRTEFRDTVEFGGEGLMDPNLEYEGGVTGDFYSGRAEFENVITGGHNRDTKDTFEPETRGAMNAFMAKTGQDSMGNLDESLTRRLSTYRYPSNVLTSHKHLGDNLKTRKKTKMVREEIKSRQNQNTRHSTSFSIEVKRTSNDESGMNEESGTKVGALDEEESSNGSGEDVSTKDSVGWTVASSEGPSGEEGSEDDSVQVEESGSGSSGIKTRITGEQRWKKRIEQLAHRLENQADEDDVSGIAYETSNGGNEKDSETSLLSGDDQVGTETAYESSEDDDLKTQEKIWNKKINNLALKLEAEAIDVNDYGKEISQEVSTESGMESASNIDNNREDDKETSTEETDRSNAEVSGSGVLEHKGSGSDLEAKENKSDNTSETRIEALFGLIKKLTPKLKFGVTSSKASKPQGILSGEGLYPGITVTNKGKQKRIGSATGNTSMNKDDKKSSKIITGTMSKNKKSRSSSEGSVTTVVKATRNTEEKFRQVGVVGADTESGERSVSSTDSVDDYRTPANNNDHDNPENVSEDSSSGSGESAKAPTSVVVVKNPKSNSVVITPNTSGGSRTGSSVIAANSPQLSAVAVGTNRPKAKKNVKHVLKDAKSLVYDAMNVLKDAKKLIWGIKQAVIRKKLLGKNIWKKTKGREKDDKKVNVKVIRPEKVSTNLPRLSVNATDSRLNNTLTSIQLKPVPEPKKTHDQKTPKQGMSDHGAYNQIKQDQQKHNQGKNEQIEETKQGEQHLSHKKKYVHRTKDQRRHNEGTRDERTNAHRTNNRGTKDHKKNDQKTYEQGTDEVKHDQGTYEERTNNQGTHDHRIVNNEVIYHNGRHDEEGTQDLSIHEQDEQRTKHDQKSYEQGINEGKHDRRINGKIKHDEETYEERTNNQATHDHRTVNNEVTYHNGRYDEEGTQDLRIHEQDEQRTKQDQKSYEQGINEGKHDQRINGKIKHDEETYKERTNNQATHDHRTVNNEVTYHNGKRDEETRDLSIHEQDEQRTKHDQRTHDQIKHYQGTHNLSTHVQETHDKGTNDQRTHEHRTDDQRKHDKGTNDQRTHEHRTDDQRKHD